MIHTMIRVLDEQRSIDFYRECFGFEVANRYEFDDFVLIYLSNAEALHELELTVNKGRTEPYDLGDGYGHIAVTVDDLDGERSRIEAAGREPGDIKELTWEGDRLGRFFFMQDPDGYKIEVLHRSGRFG